MRIIFATIIWGMALCTALYAQDMRAPSLTVSGEGRVRVAPDMAQFSIGVDILADKAQEAQNIASQRLNEIISRLKTAGIAAEDIQTSILNLSPQYDYNEDGPKLTGYRAVQQVNVRVVNLDQLGEVLRDAIAVDGSTLDGVQFGVRDPSPYLDEARRRAVADARHKAEVYSSAANVALGGIEALREATLNNQDMAFGDMRALSSKTASVPIAGGRIEFSADISVTWALNLTPAK